MSFLSFYCPTCSYDCSNPIYGQTVNPHNLQKTSGGSSGGEGALIGGGGSLLGIGSDIGGSIRIPSAFCGICGFKPTSGRLRSVCLCCSGLFPIKRRLPLMVCLCLGQLSRGDPHCSWSENRRVTVVSSLPAAYFCGTLDTYLLVCL